MGAGAADSEAENGNGVDENSGSSESENSESVSGQENGLPELGGLGTENELLGSELKNREDGAETSELDTKNLDQESAPIEQTADTMNMQANDLPMLMSVNCAGPGVVSISSADELEQCLTAPGTGVTLQLQNEITIDKTGITLGEGDYVVDLNGNDIIFDTTNLGTSESGTVFTINETTTNLTLKNSAEQQASIKGNSEISSSSRQGFYGILMKTGEDGGSLTVDNINFSGFHAEREEDGFPIIRLAAAITVSGNQNNEPSVKISNSTFSNNSGRSGHGGGAIALSYANAEIDNCTFSNNENSEGGGALYVLGDKNTTNITIKNSQFKNNESTSSNTRDGGGAIYIGSANEITLESNTFEENSSNIYGGAICISSIRGVNIIKVNINKNEFKNNTAKSIGGAIYAGGVENFELNDNILQKNQTTNSGSSGGGLAILRTTNTSLMNNQIVGNRAVKRGGGINYDLTGADVQTYNLTLEGNSINYNFAADSGINDCHASAMNVNGENCGEGGGLNLILGGKTNENDNTLPVTLDIRSGEFIGNQAADGGGIYFGVGWFYEGGNLNLHNALITGNSATRGGGVWLCAKAKVEMYSTDGSVIVDNTATGSLTYPWDGTPLPIQPFGSEGDDIFYLGTNETRTHDPQYPEIASRTLLEVTSRSWSGFPIDWYKDELGHRYSEGYREYLPPNSPYLVGVDGKGTKDLAALHGNFDYLDEANKTASLIIANNVAARRGGGIFSNNVMTFGRANADVELTVEKEFVKDGAEVEAEELLPESITVALYRINKNGEEEQIDTTELTAAGNWSHTFEELPSEGFYSGKFSYRVVEQAVDNWELASAESTNPNQVGEGNTCTYDTKGDQLACTIKLTNSYVTPPETPETPNSPDTGKFTIEGVAGKTGANISQVANFWMTLVVAVTAGLIVARKKRYI